MNTFLKIPLTAEQKALIEEAAQLDLSDTAPWARSLLVKAAAERVAASKAGKPSRKRREEE
jgi:hypothetical protein